MENPVLLTQFSVNHSLKRFRYFSLLLFLTLFMGGAKGQQKIDLSPKHSLTGFSSPQNDEDKDWRAYWHHGFRVKSTDGRFAFKFGGRIMNDWAFFRPLETPYASPGKIRRGTEFRRIRFFNSGKIFNNSVQYKLQFDFAGGRAALKDAYVAFTGLPGLGNVKIGHYKEPMGLEELTSSKYITFLERSQSSAFAPARNTGISFYDHLLNKRITWAVGAFFDAGSTGKSVQKEDKYNVTGRFTTLPYYDRKKVRFMHLGVSYSYRQPQSEKYSITSESPSHLGNNYAYTRILKNTNQDQRLGTELAWVQGPFSLQGEFIRSWVKAFSRSRFKTYPLSGYYGMASFFLTGDHRGYDPGKGKFDRVIPDRNLGSEPGGWGALELAARFQHFQGYRDIRPAAEELNLTFGLNWYPNSSTRVMFN